MGYVCRIGVALVHGELTDHPGLVTAGVCNLCIAASLAEFLSAYPTCVFLWTRVLVFRVTDGLQGGRSVSLGRR